MFSEDEALKREEERISRTLLNAGRRASFTPTKTANTWTVSGTSSPTLGNREGLKALQEQIKEEDRKQQNANGYPLPNRSPSPGLISSPSPSPTPSTAAASSEIRAPQSLFGDSDKDTKDKKNRQEEDRLERIMRRGNLEERDRRRSVDGVNPEMAAALARRGTPSPNSASLGPRFQEQVVSAAKALRSKKAEELVKLSYAVAATAKYIAEGVVEGTDILNYSKALEAGANSLRTNLDAGGDGSQYLYEMSGYLGQIYIATIAVI